MAGRKSCVNSLWSGTERVRIGERLKATLAGVLELELLRCKQLDLVDAALDNRRPEEQSCVTSRRQQDVSPPDLTALPGQNSPEDSTDGTVHTSAGRSSHSRWSTLSWDASSDLLSPPTPDPINTIHMDSDSRPSSGFYSVSGSSLSDSCYSVSSEVVQGGQASVRPQKLWDQGPVPDSPDILWTDGAVQLEQQPQTEAQICREPAEESAASALSELEATSINFLSDLCSGFSDSIITSLLQLLSPPSSSVLIEPKTQLDPRYCTDLVSRRTKEVYPYPSPLHAVALQSPLFTTQEQASQATLSPEAPQPEDLLQPTNKNDQTLHPQPNHSSNQMSFTQLEQYITRLARQYHTRVSASTTDLTLLGSVPLRGVCSSGKSHGSTQSLSAFESRSTCCSLGGNITPCKSLLGNSTRVTLSTTGKKATRNSINLGNLPSATGEDLSINLHLNLNLNLTPGLNSSRGLVDTPKTGSCGALRSDFTTASTASASSLSSCTPTPALRRPRISTCPSSLSHRSSLEVAPSFGSSHFCRSLDWSSHAPEQLSVHGSSSGSAPSSQRNSLNQEPSPKLVKDFPMVEEISRLSGLSKDVVVGLMEQGVELDIDCFDVDTPGDTKGHGKSHLMVQTDQSHEYTRELTTQRPIQLSLSVTHSPQSQSSLTPPLSHTSSPIHPYQTNYMPTPHYPPQYYPHDLPSSTASSPASRPTPRARSPPHPLQASPMGATPLSVFRRDAPFQCSLPRTSTRSSTADHCGIQPRGGSLRQSGGGWKRGEGQGLYRGKHTSHKLIRAATVSSYAKRGDYSSVWTEQKGMERGFQTPKKSSTKLWSLFGRDSESEREEMDRAEYGFGWRRNTGGSYRTERDKSSFRNNDTKVEYSPMISEKRGKDDGARRSSSLRLSRRALFRSESQGLLVSQHHDEPIKRALWVSSLDVGQGAMRKDEGVRLLRRREDDKRLLSTASLFNLSRSESLEGSCQSLSPLSSPSFSPSPPRRTLQRSRSLRDLGKKVFGSMRSLSLKRKPSKK